MKNETRTKKTMKSHRKKMVDSSWLEDDDVPSPQQFKLQNKSRSEVISKGKANNKSRSKDLPKAKATDPVSWGDFDFPDQKIQAKQNRYLKSMKTTKAQNRSASKPMNPFGEFESQPVKMRQPKSSMDGLDDIFSDILKSKKKNRKNIKSNFDIFN